MDSVRFGRALGVGARSAAKAIAGAVDAAAAPNPTPVKPRPYTTATAARNNAPASQDSAPSPTYEAAPHFPSRPASTGTIANAAQTMTRTAARASVKAQKAGEGVARGGKRFGEAAWGPVVKVTGILWLEITGAFFGLFAIFAGQAAWTHRTGLFATAADRDDRVRAFVFLAMAIGFGYFCVSSFVRARRRG